MPPAIYQLDGITINDFTVRVYHLCYGIGHAWTEKEEDYFWDVYDKNNQDPSWTTSRMVQHDHVK